MQGQTAQAAYDHSVALMRIVADVSTTTLKRRSALRHHCRFCFSFSDWKCVISASIIG